MELEYIKLTFHKSSFTDLIWAGIFFFSYAGNKQPKTHRNSKQPKTKQTVETEKTEHSSPTHTHTHTHTHIYIIFFFFEGMLIFFQFIVFLQVGWTFDMKCYLIIRGNIIHKKYFWFSGIACFDNCIYCMYVFTFTTILDSQVLKSVTLKRCITKQIQQVQWVENSLITIHMIENSLITSTFSDKQNNNCVDTT